LVALVGSETLEHSRANLIHAASPSGAHRAARNGLLILIVGIALLQLSRNAAHITTRRRSSSSSGGENLLNREQGLLQRLEARCQKVTNHFVDTAIEELSPVFELLVLILGESSFPVTSWQAFTIDSVGVIRSDQRLRWVNERILKLSAQHRLSRGLGKSVVLARSEAGLVPSVVVDRLQSVR
jgi:hypothetical protein